jgi:hypothetical protein
MLSLLSIALVNVQARQAPQTDGDDVGIRVQCAEISGASIAAPRWTPETDGTAGQTLRLRFRAQGKSTATWSRDGVDYAAEDGVGLAMPGGFAIVVAGAGLVETYVYNGGTTDVLFTQIRAGHSILPNIAKAFRGTCVLGWPTSAVTPERR